MTEPGKIPSSIATGGMSSNGTTTVVKFNQPSANYDDKKVLCSAICHCKNIPEAGVDGRSLRQVCVSKRLKELDSIMGHRSPYKPEVNYDMTKQPPAPIMSSDVETKVHNWLPGWIKKWWDVPDDDGNQRPKFKAGQEMIRRPDVVIVKDPNKPPVQENIKQVVEIKFPPDVMSDPQKEAYIQIAGSDDKLVEMGPADCDCNKPAPEPTTIPVEELGAAAAAARLLFLLLTKRPLPGSVPTPAF